MELSDDKGPALVLRSIHKLAEKIILIGGFIRWVNIVVLTPSLQSNWFRVSS